MTKKMWGKLDECIGSGILGAIALYAMHIGFQGEVVGMCVAGIVSLLSVAAAKKKEGEQEK